MSERAIAPTMTTAPDGVIPGSAAALIDGDAVIDLASSLVKLRTVNDPGAEAVEEPAAELVAALMRGYGWDVTVTEVAPGRPNVIGVITGNAPGRTLMFEGHTDVVTENDAAAWDFDPYAGDVVDGMLRGRGSADMKGGVAAMIHAARAVQQVGFDGRIIVGALVDEEEMMLGAKAFAASPLARSGIDGVIVCEPEAGEVCASSKGALRICVEFGGAMAHGAMPQIGRNPVPAVGALIGALGELQSEVQQSAGPHPELGDFYVTPTVIEAGTPAQQNVIAQTARVYLDVRTLPATEHVGVIRRITELARRAAADHDVETQIEVIDDRPAVDTPKDEPVIEALAAAHRQITGAGPVFGGVPGTTDGTILTRDAGLATVVYGPGGKWIAHQANEVCHTEDIVTAARVYAEAAQSFLATDRSGRPA